MSDADRIADAPGTKNLTAFLEMIRRCEGTYDPQFPESRRDGYRALFGYHPRTNAKHLFVGFGEHPNVLQKFQDTAGRTLYTSAAGAYQFIWPTWQAVKARLQLVDFGPSSQDIAAMELIAKRGAMPYVKSGNILNACERCAPEWASLPHANYAQPRRSVAFVLAAYIDAGGEMA